MIVGLYDETEAYAPNPADPFFQRLSATSGTPGKPLYMPNGTPFFCTADGILLKNGLRDWQKLPAAVRQPGASSVPEYKVDPERAKKNHRLTRPPANTLILRTYKRGLKLDGAQRLFAPRIIDWEYNIKLPAEPNRDFLWLREAEVKSLIPAERVQGFTFPVPAVVRDRICHWHIAGGYHCLPGYYTAEQFQSKEMTLTVEEETPQQVTLRLRGAAALKGGATYHFHGVLRFDFERKAFTRFDLIGLCDEGQDPKPQGNNVAPSRYYGIAFELSGERTDDLLPPFYLREHVGTPNLYFANGAR